MAAPPKSSLLRHSNELVAHLRSHTYLYVKDIIAYSRLNLKLDL